jgi:hypothetical protein
MSKEKRRQRKREEYETHSSFLRKLSQREAKVFAETKNLGFS